jgi:ribosomal protein L35
MSKSTYCFKCENAYKEHINDHKHEDFNSYLRDHGLCGEDCLQKYSKKEQHLLSAKFLVEGTRMKSVYQNIRYGGLNPSTHANKKPPVFLKNPNTPQTS